MSTIVKILMKRDGMTKKEAEKLIKEAQEDLLETLETEGPFSDEAQNICETYFGLEPDYIIEII